MDIKQIKPNRGKNAWTHQGYINPKSCKKLFPQFANDPIRFMSDWERVFMIHCENDPRVKYWASECMEIPYEMNGKTHRYFPDMLVEFMDGRRFVFEIKPKEQCKRPINENSWLWNEYNRNRHKWAAARKFCEARGLIFKILTEDTINAL